MPRFIYGWSPKILGWIRTLVGMLTLTEVASWIAFIIPYSVFLVWLGSCLASVSHLSVLWWIPIIVGLAPLTVLAYRNGKKRLEVYVGLLMDNRPGLRWDIDEAINEYLALFRT